MPQQYLPIRICSTPKDAPHYNKPMQEATILEAVIVRQGTIEGRSTVDLVFESPKGRFVTMLTGRLIKTLATAIGDEP